MVYGVFHQVLLLLVMTARSCVMSWVASSWHLNPQSYISILLYPWVLKMRGRGLFSRGSWNASVNFNVSLLLGPNFFTITVIAQYYLNCELMLMISSLALTSNQDLVKDETMPYQVIIILLHHVQLLQLKTNSGTTWIKRYLRKPKKLWVRSTKVWQPLSYTGSIMTY